MANYFVETYIPFSYEIEAESKEEAQKKAEAKTLEEVRDQASFIDFIKTKSVLSEEKYNSN